MQAEVVSEHSRKTVRRPKIAVACSGLGHVFRGVETWAADLARALHLRGEDVTLFQGAGTASADWETVLHCKRRLTPDVERMAKRFARFGGWRYGLGSGYQIEQTSFVARLWPLVRRHYDIVHTQDYWIALLMERLYRAGLSRPRVILAHGTEEPTDVLQKYSFLQHLAPCYRETYEAHRPPTQHSFAIGNFVKTDLFRPGDTSAARAEWGLPQDALIVLSVAAIKKHHKRVDFLIREFAAFSERFGPNALLVVAGGREPETEEVMELGRSLLGDRVRFLEGVSRDRMPGLYQTADIFALASLHEMMPIAVLEAISSGLPVLCSDTPTFRWMVGPAGLLADISREGSLTNGLHALADPCRRQALAAAARLHAETYFSEEAIVKQILEMYDTVLESARRPKAGGRR